MKSQISPKAALAVFLFLVVFVIVQGVWWVVFMAQLADEKVDIARELGGTHQYVEKLHQQEITRQIMIGTEGAVFLLLLLAGIWLIYNTLVRTQRLKVQQQNFLMAVTHELKTPLASMKLYLDTLASSKIAPERKLEILPRMREDVQRLEGIVENILEAGRFERHSHKLTLECVDLSALTVAEVEAAKKHHVQLPLEVVSQVEPGLEVDGDAVVLGRAIRAVLDNALKYHDGARIAIHVKLSRRESDAVLVIADQGIGLEKGETTAIFERFYRVGNELTRQTEGTGLGLYLCREMIRAHRGEVTARSEGLGKGTSIEITLPIRGLRQ